MPIALKQIAKALLPRPVIAAAKRLAHAGELRAAAAALDAAPAEPAWLQTAMLSPLIAAYPPKPRPPSAPVEPRPDHVRAAAVLDHLGSSQRLLEVGAGPGFVSWAAALAGRDVTALDLSDPLAPEAAAAGVVGWNGDACRLPFADNTFDGLWSINAYEHIHSPAEALAEAWRVVRPGGRVHLNFAPLYHSPLGLHAFREIGVPFCQHLWTEQQLATVVKSEGFWFLNYWSLAKYRQLWAEFRLRLKPIRYVEERDYQGIELIRRFPSCFAKRSRDLNEFTVAKIVATFEVMK